MKRAWSITVKPQELEALLESFWLLLWQAAQPLPHPGIRPGLVAGLYEQAILLAESVDDAGEASSPCRLWKLAQHHRHRLTRWREEIHELYDVYGEL